MTDHPPRAGLSVIRIFSEKEKARPLNIDKSEGSRRYIFDCLFVLIAIKR